MTYADEDDSLLCLIAGSICKDFSSMGDGNRLVGRNVSCQRLTLMFLWLFRWFAYQGGKWEGLGYHLLSLM